MKKQPKIQWFRYRQKYAYGKGDWVYKFTTEDDQVKTAKDFAYRVEETSKNLDTWSEHYRGVEAEKVRKPPEDILSDRISDCAYYVKHHKETLALLKAEKKKHYPVKTKKK